MNVWSSCVMFLIGYGALPGRAAELVLDPGPGTDYLNYWCGGQQVNEIATGFDESANVVTLVKVSTTCHGSGRGSPNQYHLACWTVTFAQDGSIVSKELLANNFWTQGHPAIPCPLGVDPAATFTHTDGAGNFPATLHTQLIGTTNRAVLDATCTPIHYGQTVSGIINEAGADACFSFTGSLGDGLRANIVETAGSLHASTQVRRPDGAVLCGDDSGELECVLDESGLHTIVVYDAQGLSIGSFDLTLTCLTPSCGAKPPQPHPTIDMSATLTHGRFVENLVFNIVVGNIGGAATEGLVLEDLVPAGVYVRGVTATQGSCTHNRQSVSCSVGSLAPSEMASIKITTFLLQAGDSVTNTACIGPDTCATTTTQLSGLGAKPIGSK